MIVSYDRAAIHEYIDDINSVGESMRRSKDECVSSFKSCEQQYSRLHTELEQKVRKAYNEVEYAESEQRAAEAEIEAARRDLENARDESARESAQRRLQVARKRKAEADKQFAIAYAEYQKYQAALRKLEELWSRYQLQMNSAANKVEDGLVSFLTVVDNGNRDLGEYMGIMDKAKSALYEGTPGTMTSGGGSSFKGGGSSGQAVSGGENPTSNFTSVGGNVGRSDGNSSSISEISSPECFKTSSGNSVGLANNAGSDSIVMTLDGQEYNFPNTKSGAAKAYRTACQSGDSELICRTKDMFKAGGAISDSGASGDRYIENTLADLQDRLPDTFDREMVMAGAEIRKLRSPNAITSEGDVKGHWNETVFFLDDDFVPKYANERGLTIAEIKQELHDSCGINLGGIPFDNGIADFSSISVASIPTKDIVTESRGMTSQDYDSLEPLERTRLFSEVFDEGRRNQNFDLADRLAAERKIPIPGLPEGYTAQDLKAWRSDPKHRCTWDEQVNSGYNLVPSIIHGNISHTGLVGSSSTAVEYFDRRKNDSPEKYSWDESEAPISIDEFLKNNNQIT